MFDRATLLTAALLLSLLALFGCTDYPETPKAETSTDYQADRILEGLDTPWNISWLPNGDMLVTERAGQIRVFRDGAAMTAQIDALPDLFTDGNEANFKQAGLFEAEPHPDFSENGLVYLTYAKGTRKRNTLALARGRWVDDGGTPRLEDIEVIFEADAWRSTRQHYGGRMVWLADGTLLLTSGDGYGERFEAQNLDSHFGKILRLTADGAPAPGNPHTARGATAAYIWSHGHRNPQGITRAPDGRVYSNEHGPMGGDELNVIEAHHNYGWPLVSLGRDYVGGQVTPLKSAEGLDDPLVHWLPSIAPSSVLFYTGDAFPAWQGHLLNSALAGRHVRIVDPASPGGTEISILSELDLRWRDIAQGPDGLLYAAGETKDREGAIYRISPAP